MEEIKKLEEIEVERFSRFDRFVHWLTAVPFVYLFLSGLGIEGIYQGRKHLHKAYRVYARAFFLYPLEEHPLLIYPVEPVPFYNAV